MKLSKLFLAFLIVSIPIVSAYTPFYYYLSSPSELLQSEWVVFILMFAIFFAVTYFAIGKTIKSKGAATIISAAVAIFIAAAVSQRAWYSGFMGDSLGSWFLLAALVVGFLMLLRVIGNMFGGIGMIVLVFIGWYLVKGMDVFYYLPSGLMNSDISGVLEFIVSPDFIWVLVGITVLILLIAYGGKGETPGKLKNWLWGKKEKKRSILEMLSESRN
jgi:hypothetical protein